MKRMLVTIGLPIIGGLLGLGLIFQWWIAGGRQPQLTPRIPGTDRAPGTATAAAANPWDGRLINSNGLPAQLAGSWPRFRGTNYDGICTDPTPLAKTWPAEGPPVLWTIDVGEGYAGAAIWRGRVYLMDYDQTAKADALRCLSLDDGREIWRFTYSVKVKRDHGMSRTIPTVTENYIVAMGPKCQVTCVDTETGAYRWTLNLVEAYDTEIPPWYTGQCPLIDGNYAIIAPGGNALMVALDCATGKVAWQSPNPRDWQMTHSSIIPMDYQGRRLYLYCASKGVVAVDAHNGSLLWECTDWKISIANVPSPVLVGDDKVFLSGGYNAGSLMLQMTQTNGGLTAATVFRLKPTVFGATQQTPICYDHHLFGIRPDGQFVCLSLDGDLVWNSGSGAENRFGSGPFLLAQGLFFLMNDNGVLTLALANTQNYQPLAQAKILSGHDSWGPMALADGRLIVRDLTQMACLDVSAK